MSPFSAFLMNHFSSLATSQKNGQIATQAFCPTLSLATFRHVFTALTVGFSKKGIHFNSRKSLVLIFGLILFGSNAQNSSNKPLKNFDALCELLDKNYASFEEKNIDWQERCGLFRKKVSSSTSDAALFYIMAQLLKPLNDAHVTLKAKKMDSSFSASRESRILNELRPIPLKNLGREFKKMTEYTLTQNGFAPMTEIGPKFRGKKLFGYTKNKTVGYLRFYRSFSYLVMMNGVFLDKQLNTIFNSFKDLDAVIIDIRFNRGGDDRFIEKVVGRFVDNPTVGYYKQTRSDGKFGELKTVMIEPKGKEPFLKPVVLLTNDRTVSAADVLALMMGQVPNATLIGEASNGSYSDLFHRKLPNGWRVTLSNQRYLSVNKINYEGLGTPVDIEVKNTLENIEAYKDDVLLRALAFLSSK